MGITLHHSRLATQLAKLPACSIDPTPCLHACRWLLTNFDCSCMWVQDADPLKAALSLTPAFLRAKGNAYDYKVI